MSERAQGPASVESAALVRKLRWLTLFRVLLVTLLLAATVFFNLQTAADGTHALPDRLLYTSSWMAYAASAIYLVLLNQARDVLWLKLIAYVQLVGDVVLSAVLVYLTGGTDSVFSFFFSLTIINAAIILYRIGAFVLATASCAALVAFAVGELGLWSWFPAHGVEAWAPARPEVLLDEAALLQSRVHNVGVNTFAFFAIAGLASYLSEQVRRTDKAHQETRSSLEELKALHRNIVNSVMSGLVTVTQDGRITFFNRVAENLTGLREEQVLGRYIEDVFPNLHFSAEGALREASYPATRTTEENLRGEHMYLRWSISPLRDAADEPIGHVLFLRDITHLLEMEMRIQRAEQLAAVGELAARVAHEIRNPLASISASVELLSRQPATTPIAKRLMEIVRREVDSLNAWIGDFLDYSREWKLDRRPVSIGTLVAETVEAFRHEEPAAEVTNDFEADPSATVVRVDPQRLKQVFWNLLRNAAEASEPGGRVQVSVSVREYGARAVAVEVRDWGHGIPQGDAAHIFEPFFTTKTQGTGLGLATSQRVVEAHGGHIEVASAPGEGTRMTVVLPFVPPEEAVIPGDEVRYEAHPDALGPAMLTRSVATEVGSGPTEAQRGS